MLSVIRLSVVMRSSKYHYAGCIMWSLILMTGAMNVDVLCVIMLSAGLLSVIIKMLC
jgi:hypothetical protein